MSHPLPDDLATPTPSRVWVVGAVIGGALALVDTALLAWSTTL